MGRPESIYALALALLLLSGCASVPLPEQGIQNFPPKGAIEPLKGAKSLVEKSRIPEAGRNVSAQIELPSEQPLPLTDSAENKTAQGQNSSSPLPLPDAPAIALSNNTSTQVTAPSPESAEAITSEISIARPGQPQVYFYYSTYCPYSLSILPQVQKQQARFENFTEWHSFNVFTQQGYYFFDKMLAERNLSGTSRVVPILIVGDRVMVGIQEINSTMVSMLWNITKKQRLAAN